MRSSPPDPDTAAAFGLRALEIALHTSARRGIVGTTAIARTSPATSEQSIEFADLRTPLARPPRRPESKSASASPACSRSAPRDQIGAVRTRPQSAELPACAALLPLASLFHTLAAGRLVRGPSTFSRRRAVLSSPPPDARASFTLKCRAERLRVARTTVSASRSSGIVTASRDVDLRRRRPPPLAQQCGTRVCSAGPTSNDQAMDRIDCPRCRPARPPGWPADVRDWARPHPVAAGQISEAGCPARSRSVARGRERTRRLCSTPRPRRARSSWRIHTVDRAAGSTLVRPRAGPCSINEAPLCFATAGWLLAALRCRWTTPR